MAKKTRWVIFTDPKSFPKHPAYEGTDTEEAAKVVIKACEGKDRLNTGVAIRVRWRGKLSVGLVPELNLMGETLKRLRK
jgi:hypothetical protein